MSNDTTHLINSMWDSVSWIRYRQYWLIERSTESGITMHRGKEDIDTV